MKLHMSLSAIACLLHHRILNARKAGGDDCMQRCSVCISFEGAAAFSELG